MAKTMLLALLLAVTGTAHAESAPTKAPMAAAASPRATGAAGAFLGAIAGGTAGWLLAQYEIHQREAGGGERLHGPDAAFTQLGFGVAGALLGAVVGYIIARPVAGPPPVTATAWSDLGRPTIRFASAPRDGRIVIPVLQLSF
jgi:hypothetical protein